MIQRTLVVDERIYVDVERHIRHLVATPNLDTETKDRYRGAVEAWGSGTWTSNESYRLCAWCLLHRIVDLEGQEETVLWDLWGVIPADYPTIRDTLRRFLDRSPLIKLAECSE